MIVTEEEKKQILLASRNELNDVDTKLGRNNITYREVLNYIKPIVEQCRQLKLCDEIREIKIRPSELKKCETIKEKILRKRAEGWKTRKTNLKNYCFDSVTDVIGLKIICGYLSDQKPIEKWIRSTFKVIEKQPVIYASGYMAWHYIVCLKKKSSNKLPNRWMSVPCEIQVKTLLQNAWDEKTHDLVYRKSDVSQFESAQFTLLSRALDVADKQSEMFRLEIEEARKEEQQRRQAALQGYYTGIEEAEASVGYKGKQGISNAEISKLITEIKARAAESDRIEDPVAREEKKMRVLDLGVIRSLETTSEQIKKWTLDYATLILTQYPDNASIWRSISTAYWALGDRYASLYAVLNALHIAERQQNDREKDFSIRGLVHFIADYGREDLKNLGLRLLDNVKEFSPALLETKGLFLIKMATTEAEVEEGMASVQHSIELAEKSGDSNLKQTAEGFYNLDRLIAERKLKGLRLKAKFPSQI